jgi:hypothetical protein
MVRAATLLAVSVSFLHAAPAFAADPFFYWHFSEFFSNADGSVQFIELECDDGLENEVFANEARLHSEATGNSLWLTQNLSGSTLNKKLLLATEGFDALPGAVPRDFQTIPLPAGFFNPAGDTITLYHHMVIDSRTIVASNPVPTDSVLSRIYPENVNATNSPTNFAGQTGSVLLLASGELPGDYNDDGVVGAADYVVWRDNFGTTNTIPNDVTPHWVMEDDYAIWRQYFGLASGSATLVPSHSVTVPEPSQRALLLIGALAACLFQRHGFSRSGSVISRASVSDLPAFISLRASAARRR